LLADARLDLARYQKLASERAIATQTVDTQAALVKQDEGTVLTDQGAVAAAQVNVNYCRIVSRRWMGGSACGWWILATWSASAAQSASTPSTAAATNNSSGTSSGSSGIVVVNQIEPIAVTFTVPEGDFQNLLNMSDQASPSPCWQGR
jgi:multidrug efflux system membrane fusion protein